MVEQSLSPESGVQPEEPPSTGRVMRLPRSVFPYLLLVVLLVLGWIGWSGAWQAPRTIALRVNGQVRQLHSRQGSVGAFLREQGYQLAPQDILYPPRAAPLPREQPVLLFLARDITLVADGGYRRLLTQAERVGDFLLEQGIRLAPDDRLLLDGREVDVEDYLPLLLQDGERPRGELQLLRAVPIVVDEDGRSLELTTHERTLGEALLAHGILLYEGDRITPDLATRLSPGMIVRIRRATPVAVTVDGRTIRARTHARTVEALLAEQEIRLRELDRLSVPLDQPITEGLQLKITRVDHRIMTEHETIPFETRWVARPDLELDNQLLIQKGQEGVFTRETLIVYEDGQERERSVQREFVEQPPQDEIHAYGTKIVIRTIQTPDGPRQYWRRIRMLATSYTAATSGKSRDHPAYGITRTGVRAGYGIVAVDPRVVDLRSYVYVPGYGVGYAGDTGGAIKGRRIDLGYDEWNLRLWYKSVDVYLLTPVPPESEIRYILP